MGAFNVLQVGVSCHNCDHTFTGTIQFKYGNTWQHSYQLGDFIKWSGKAADIGNVFFPKVKVYGIVENVICPNCKQNISEEYDLYVTDNVIERVSKLKNLGDYSADLNYGLLI